MRIPTLFVALLAMMATTAQAQILRGLPAGTDADCTVPEAQCVAAVLVGTNDGIDCRGPGAEYCRVTWTGAVVVGPGPSAGSVRADLGRGCAAEEAAFAPGQPTVLTIRCHESVYVPGGSCSLHSRTLTATFQSDSAPGPLRAQATVESCNL